MTQSRPSTLDIIINNSEKQVSLLVHGAWLSGKVVSLGEWLTYNGSTEGTDTEDPDGVYLVDAVSRTGALRVALAGGVRVTKTSIDAVFPGSINDT